MEKSPDLTPDDWTPVIAVGFAERLKSRLGMPPSESVSDQPDAIPATRREAMTEARDIERLFEIWEQNVTTVRQLNASREKLGLEPGFAPTWLPI